MISLNGHYIGLITVIVILGVTVPLAYSQGSQSITVDAVPGGMGVIDTNVITPSDRLLFRTASVTAGFTGFAGFIILNTDDVSGGPSVFTVENREVRFSVAPNTPPGMYETAYRNFLGPSAASSTIRINVAAAPTIPSPQASPISVETTGAPFTINFFGNVTDADNGELSIVFTFQNDDERAFFDITDATVDPTNPNRYTLDTNPASFAFATVPTDDRTITIDYIVSDADSEDASTITINYQSLVAADDISLTLEQDQPGTLDFSSAITRAEADFANLAITFETTTGATGPAGVTSLSSQFTFVGATLESDGTFTVDTANAAVTPITITPITDAVTGDYTFPYTVVDSDSSMADAQILITVNSKPDSTPFTVSNDNFAHTYSLAEQTFTKIFTDEEFAELVNAQANGFGSTLVPQIQITIDASSSTSTISFSNTDNTLSYTPVVDDTTEYPIVESFTYTATLGTRSGSGTFTFTTNSAQCSFENTNPASFGALADTQISEESTFSISNTGTAPLTLTLGAEDWTSTEQTGAVMVSGATAYSTSSNTYTEKLKFESGMTFALDNTIAANAAQMIYLQLQIDLIDGTFTGPLQQNLSLAATC